MSSRARRTGPGGVMPFPWGAAPVQAPHTPPEPPSACELPPVEPAPPPVDHQASFAALERDAFTKGYAQGERAGAEAGLKRAEAMLRRLGETLEELAGLRQQMLQHSERQLVELALAIARRVVRKEVVADGELLGALARVALERLGETTGATIRLNPEDLARLPAHQVDGWAAARVTVVADTSLARGACLIESPFGFVDAGIDAQFQELARTLLDSEHAGLELGTRR